MSDVNVTSITISYNPDLIVLRRQIEALDRQVNRILVIDNGSENFSEIESLKLLSSKLEIIPLHENRGIAFAQNVGIELAVDSSSHVILFDHDSELEDSFIKNLLQSEADLLSSGLKVGAVGPSFVNADTGKRYGVPVIRKLPIFQGLVLDKRFFSRNEKFIESYFLIASGCLIQTSVLKHVGSMDSELFIDNVDVEWCLRAQIKGYEVYTSSLATMVHRIGERSRTVMGRNISVHSNIRKYYNTRNNLFLVKYSGIPLGLKIRVFPSLTVRFFIGILDADNKVDYFSKYFWAIYDFILNKKGKFNH